MTAELGLVLTTVVFFIIMLGTMIGVPLHHFSKQDGELNV